MARLTVGVATYDDFDGVYFTLQGIRLWHGEDAGDVEFIILDNHPDGRDAAALTVLAAQIPGCRYIPFAGYTGTSVHDLIFREATGEIVLCLDAHVLLAPGAVRNLLGYFAGRPSCRDLLQGPMLADDLTTDPFTHLEPGWHQGLWGRWATDPRGLSPDAEPFEIGMQGLGLFACRRDAWPGLHPHLRGHGGAEGYVQELFRRTGGSVICHPAVRWLHRVLRPGGPPYPLRWRDRVRNYLLVFGELGLDSGPYRAHLADVLGPEHAADVLDRASRDARSPLSPFDAVFCTHRDAEPARWNRARQAFAELDADWLVEPVLIGETGPEDVLRSVVAEARRRHLTSVLLIDDAAIPGRTDAAGLAAAAGPEPVLALPGVLAIHRDAHPALLDGDLGALEPVAQWLKSFD